MVRFLAAVCVNSMSRAPSADNRIRKWRIRETHHFLWNFQQSNDWLTSLFCVQDLAWCLLGTLPGFFTYTFWYLQLMRKSYLLLNCDISSKIACHHMYLRYASIHRIQIHRTYMRWCDGYFLPEYVVSEGNPEKFYDVKSTCLLGAITFFLSIDSVATPWI